METTESAQGNVARAGSDSDVSDVDQPHLDLQAGDDGIVQAHYINVLEARVREIETKMTRMMKVKQMMSKALDGGWDTSDEEASEEIDTDDSDPEKSEASEDSEDEEQGDLTFIPEARKINLTNFASRFPKQTQMPVVEALMIDTTFDAAHEEYRHWMRKLRSCNATDAWQMMKTSWDTNLYRPDAWIARIRLNSPSLAKEIIRIIKPNETTTKPFIFKCPFQPLIENHGKIKARLEELRPTPRPSEDVIATAQDEDVTQVFTFLDCYVQFMEKEIIHLYDDKRTKINYSALPTIFQLGDTIYVPTTTKSSKHDPQILANRQNQRLWRLYRIVEGWDNLMLKCYALDYDGESYVCIKKSFKIDAYIGEQSISSLSVYPLKYADNAEQIRAECIAQGQRFLDSVKDNLLSHNGWALEPDPRSVSDSPLQYIASNVVVDFAEALKVHPNWKPEWKLPNSKGKEFHTKYFRGRKWEVHEKYGANYRWIRDNYWDNDQFAQLEKIEYCTKKDPFLSNWFLDEGKNYTLREEELMLLPRRLFAYVLQERRFVAVDIQNLKSVEDNWTHARNLIINKYHESMLHALVNSHFKRKELHDNLGLYNIGQDIIANKGRGLVILLYGVPGVGKTSTAENIAHSWKRPLLPITCGDLGIKPSEVESHLKEIFRLAQLWDCILLLDEADVFLSERSPSALERNALVSVFLRMLEYYTGILFLTTNLPGNFDEGFKSRIHISLYYPHLDKDTTLKIWDMNLRRLAEIERERAEATQETALTIDVKGITKFAKKHYRSNEDGKGRWNGRQIRNAFLIASAIAHFEKDNPGLHPRAESPRFEPAAYDIKPEHFQVVADSSMGFERYLLQTKGRTAGEVAFQRGLRADFIRSPSDKFEEKSSPLMPSHDDSMMTRYSEPASSGRTPPWGYSVARGHERYPSSQQSSFNDNSWDMQQRHREALSLDKQSIAHIPSKKDRHSMNRRAGSSLAGGSRDSWTPSRQSRSSFLQPPPSSGRFATENDRDSDDSEDDSDSDSN